MNIKEERKKRSMTQQDFADLLCVTRKTIVNYESGSNIPEHKKKLFGNILKNYDISYGFKDDNSLVNNNEVIKVITEKFEGITEDEVALYFNSRKESMLKNPLIKSIIKSEAWKIIELEMQSILIEKRSETKE
ncbi:helix-turn-helix transcriptional regulator [Aquimarina longa]|uniref:helix-turn-helix transcriptional regulator n=1 Tax=Aquimarina longa TaxID=1080221 RepID=UPI0021CDDF1A|nr:helix-turn-helix transcriptional regulator [Aquimarina longa]